MEKQGSSAIAFLMGIIAGGVAGLLFAPKSGKETRSDLQKYFNDAEESLARKKDELMEAAARETAKLKQQASEAFENEKKKFTDSLSKFKKSGQAESNSSDGGDTGDESRDR